MTIQNIYPICRYWEKGIVLDISSYHEDHYGFLPIQNMTEALKNSYLSKAQGDTIHARYLKPTYTPEQYPIFTQRGIFQIDENYNLLFRSEDEDHITFEAPDNCLYTIKKVFWERGPLYQPPEEGASIECRIISITEEGYPHFERVNLDNPYFKHPTEIIKSNSIIQLFEDWLGYPDNDVKIQLCSLFNAQNPKYLFSMIKLLEKETKNDLRRADYDRAKIKIEQMLLVYRWILKSGFLSIQDDEYRTDTKDRAKDAIGEWKNYLIVIETVRSGRTAIFLKTLSTASLSNSNKMNLQFGQLLRILTISPDEMVDSILLEDSVRPIINDGTLFSRVYPYNSLLVKLRNRKKTIRKLLFHRQGISLAEPFHDKENMKHYLFLLDMEYQRSVFLKDDTNASIDKATLMTSQAMLTENIALKSKQFKDTINFLKLQQFDAASFDSDEDRINWSHSKNILLARCYEYLANLETSLPEKLLYLNFSVDHYKRGTDRKGYIISHYYDYYDLLQQFESKDIMSTLKKETETRLLRIDESFLKNNTNPVLVFFRDFYIILSLMGRDDLESIEILTDFIGPAINQPSEFPEIAMLARQVLANNIIIPITKDNYSYYDSIKKYLIAREISAPIYEETITDPMEIENHKIFEEENQSFEMKGSFFIDINYLLHTGKNREGDEIKDEACKTIAGMLNSDGGEFIIGVLEADRYNDKKMRAALNKIDAVRIGNRVIVGVEHDLNLFKFNSDHYILKISEHLRNRICDNVASFIHIIPEVIEGRTILRITISPYPDETGVAVDKINFYIRENNQTMSYDPVEFFKLRRSKSKQINLSPD